MADEKLDVAAVMSAIKERGASWQAGATSMTALPPMEQRRRLGVTPPPEAPSIEEIVQRATALGPSFGMQTPPGAPASFDLRNVDGQNFVTPIRDQGNCGSCVAFGTCAAIEATFRRQRGDANLQVDLSEAHLFYCLAKPQGVNCGTGWWPDKALTCAKETGITAESSFPYTAGDQDCSKLASDWQSHITQISGFHAVTGDVAAMKEWISTHGALTACLVVYNDFFSYHSGVYRHVTGAQAGGHCVSIVGYSDAEGCWICKNSWGTGWGDNGFFKIAYGECGIDTWQVHAVEGIVETGWLNNTYVQGLWTIDQDRNAYVYLQGTGWRRVAFDNDNVFVDMLTQLVSAKAGNRPVNVYQANGIITQIYVL